LIAINVLAKTEENAGAPKKHRGYRKYVWTFVVFV